MTEIPETDEGFSIVRIADVLSLNPTNGCFIFGFPSKQIRRIRSDELPFIFLHDIYLAFSSNRICGVVVNVAREIMKDGSEVRLDDGTGTMILCLETRQQCPTVSNSVSRARI
jgi:hypothetical protein